MKLKYYLRGMGIGIILTAIVMGFALGGRKATISDAEVIQRAKELGMIEAGTGVLTQNSSEAGQNDEKTDTSTPDTTLDQKGEEVSQEVDQELTGTDNTVSDMAGEEEESQNQKTEEGGAEAESPDDDAQGAAEEPVKTTEVAENTETTVETQQAAAENETVAEEASAENTASTETASADTGSTAQDNGSAQTASATTAGGKSVTIPGGLGSEAVAAILEREGFIDNAVSFNKYLVDRRVDRIIRSGVKTIPAGATYEQIADIITK